MHTHPAGRAERQCTATLQHAVPLKEVHDKVRGYVASRDASLLTALPEHFGELLGTPKKLISAESSEVAQTGELYALVLSLQSESMYLELADTVSVVAGPAVIITSTKRKFNDVAYYLNDAEDLAPEPKQTPNLRRPTRKNQVAQSSSEIKRKQAQKELRLKKQDELRDRFQNSRPTQAEASSTRLMTEISAYPSVDAFPDSRRDMIFVDTRQESVLVPLKDQKVPFHVSTIKNVSKSEEGRYTYLRINFFAPGTALKDLGYELPALHGNQAYFLHELLFRSADSKSAATAYRMLKELIKRVKHKDQEAQQKKDLVEQGALVVLRGKRPLLSDLTVRPSISGKKTTGVLEGHQNGLRFTSSRGDKLDLLYSNIKHAFFQPVEHELCVLLHFHLHHGVMVGSRKVVDLQFYTEAGVQSDDLGGRARELDEVQLEQRERRVRDKLNHEFKSFVEQVQHVASGALEFDLPYRELGFFGVPFKSNVFLMPTVNCLVNLAEQPFFVCVLSDIECVHFERIAFGVRNFDMVLVFKDYTRVPHRISSVPIESLDAIKDWLTNVELVYSEGPNPLNWPNVMKEVTDDIPAFVEQGGWEFLQEDSEEEQPEPSEQEDSDFDDKELSEESSDSDSEVSENEGDDEEEEDEDSDEDEDEPESSESEAPKKRTKTSRGR